MHTHIGKHGCVVNTSICLDGLLNETASVWLPGWMSFLQ